MPNLRDLTPEQLQALLACVRELSDISRADDFHEHVIKATQPLVADEWIACERYAVNGDDRLDGVITPEIPPETLDVFVKYVTEHPLIQHMQHDSGNSGPITWASSLGGPNMHEGLNIYQEFYKRLEISQQATIWWRDKHHQLLTYALSRDGAYSPSELAVLTALRPHMINAYNNWEAMQQLTREPLWMLDGLEAIDAALVLLSPQARILRWTPQAETLLSRHFPKTHRVRGRLPSVLSQWIKAHLREDPTTFIAPAPYQGLSQNVDGPAGLSIRLVFSESHQNYLLILQESRGLPSPEELQARFGLTPQRANVLHLLAQGKSNAQIADAMCLSVGTIRKHLEYVYQTLGVSSRSEAVARVSTA